MEIARNAKGSVVKSRRRDTECWRSASRWLDRTPTTLWVKRIYDLGAAPKELNRQVPAVMTGDSFKKSLRCRNELYVLLLSRTLIGADGCEQVQ